MGPSICREDEVDQAVREIQDKLRRMRIAESKSRAIEKGDIQELSGIPKQIRKQWG